MILPQTSSGGEGGTGPNQNGARASKGPSRTVSPAIGSSLSPGSWSRSVSNVLTKPKTTKYKKGWKYDLVIFQS